LTIDILSLASIARLLLSQLQRRLVMPQSRFKLRMICFAFVLLLFPALSSAQSDSGRISGSVKDQNGAIVPGAEVNVTNDRTGEERTGTTNAQGSSSVTGLRASAYTVTAVTSGLSAKLQN